MVSFFGDSLTWQGGYIDSLALPQLFQARRLHHATIDFAKPEAVAAMKRLVDDHPHLRDAYARHGVADKHGLCPRFRGEMDRHVKSRGRRTIVRKGIGHGQQPERPRDVTVMADEALDHLPGCLAADGDPVINATRKPLHAVNQRCCEPAEIRQWNRLRRDHFVEGLPAFGGLELPETRAVIGGHLCAWEQSDEQELPSLRRRLPALAEALWRLERFDRLPSRRLPPP